MSAELIEELEKDFDKEFTGNILICLDCGTKMYVEEIEKKCYHCFNHDLKVLKKKENC